MEQGLFIYFGNFKHSFINQKAAELTKNHFNQQTLYIDHDIEQDEVFSVGDI